MATYPAIVRSVRIPFIAFIVVLLLSACSAIDSRISQHEIEFKAYPPDIQTLIKNGQIRPGFTETQVYIAWGEPYYRGGNQWTYPGYDCKNSRYPRMNGSTGGNTRLNGTNIRTRKSRGTKRIHAAFTVQGRAEVQALRKELYLFSKRDPDPHRQPTDDHMDR